MIKTKEYFSATNPNTLCETYSTLGRSLIQQETGIVYGNSVVDVIDHYEDGSPVSRFTYVEEGSTPGEITPEQIVSRLEEIL